MPVTRLRPRRDARERDSLETLRDLLVVQVGMGAPADLVGPMVTLVDRRLAAGRGWNFVMVEPRLYANVVAHLTRHSSRPLKAVELFTRLFSYLPADSNEVMASRDELARMVDARPAHVSEIMRELEAIGAVYRRREGRGVRYSSIRTWVPTSPAPSAGEQALAPALRLVEPAE